MRLKGSGSDTAGLVISGSKNTRNFGSVGDLVYDSKSMEENEEFAKLNNSAITRQMNLMNKNHTIKSNKTI